MMVQGIEVPPWVDIAEGELWVRERRGRSAHNPRIIEYHATTTLSAERDETPWCSSFINWCMEEAGYEGTRSALARSWLSWGAASSNMLGSVVVIRRRVRGQDDFNGSYSGFHVGFFMRSNDRVIRMLSGNARNGVRYTNYPLRRYDVMGYRMPEDYT